MKKKIITLLMTLVLGTQSLQVFASVTESNSPSTAPVNASDKSHTSDTSDTSDKTDSSEDASTYKMTDKGTDKNKVMDKGYPEFLMKKLDFAVYKDSEDWQKVREEFLDKVSKASTYYEADLILKEYVKKAGGKHSNVFNPNDFTDPKEMLFPEYELRDDILVLKLPEFSGTLEESQKYAEKLIEPLKNEKYSGVIVDLRKNGGGDMGPMILGISPLIPDGNIMTFSMGKNKSSVTLKDGKNIGGGTTLSIPEANFKIQVPIAVLQGKKTASSGEQTLLALKTGENVKTFGEVSAGYLTANMVYPLKSGLSLMLSVGNTVDINGIEYSEEGIEPDIQASPEEAETKALEWLRKEISEKE